MSSCTDHLDGCLVKGDGLVVRPIFAGTAGPELTSEAEIPDGTVNLAANVQMIL
jgi:hypothetical protein